MPIKVWSALQVLLIAPGAILAAHNPELIHRDVRVLSADGIPSALISTFLIFSILNAVIIATYYSTNTFVNGLYAGRSSQQVQLRPEDKSIIYILFALASLGFLFKLQSVGGLSYILENVNLRVSLQRGLGPLNYFVDTFLLLACVIAAKRHALTRHKTDFWVLVVIFVLSVFFASLFGGRKFAIHLFIYCLIVYSVYRDDFLKFKPNSILSISFSYFVIIVYFFLVLTYRKVSNFDEFIQDLPTLLHESVNSFSYIFISVSYLDTYIFVVEFFNSSNFYYGATFRDLLYAFVPSAYFPLKPPVDDGLYIRAASLGGYLEPGTPAVTLRGLASWPGETFGTAYMNGGIPMIVIFGIIQGMVFSIAYLFFQKNPNSTFRLVLMMSIFINFKISNLRISNLFALIVCLVVSYFMVKVLMKFRFRRVNHVTQPQH
ncbi:O-antigen polymerase [Anderseniella sp. Alg231-50]|uniref:O-antigen polymerase n=1 Tax=Anderseniella sp. Alg231-50 TaxID=1922226 RepID=UPI00307C25B9